MKVVHKNQGTDLLSVIPTPPSYYDVPTKRHWQRLAKVLISTGLLKRIHLDALGLMAQNLAQHEYALKAINKKNKRKSGTGYIQKFTSGASNLSPEITLKEKSEKAIFQCLKQFGLDPKSEKDLNLEPSNQLDLFETVMQKLTN